MQHPQPFSEWVNVPQAALALGVSERTIRKRISTGAMRATRVSPRLWIIHHTEIERWRALGPQRPGRKPGSQRTPDTSTATGTPTPAPRTAPTTEE